MSFKAHSQKGELDMSEKVWLEYYPEEVAPSYEYPKQNLAQFMIDTAKKSSRNKPQFFFYGKRSLMSSY